jgi:sugar lactone lactonase YvrE
MPADFVRVLDGPRFALGECARWHSGALYWVDIPAGTLWCRSADRGEKIRILPGTLGSVTPTTDGRWIVACGSGLAVMDGPSLRWLHRLEHPAGPIRMNDSVADPAGRFLVGSMSAHGQAGMGALHRLEFGGSLTTLLDGLTTPNGPAFSSDGTRMYLADSRARRIDVFAYDPQSGDLSNRRPFVQLGPDDGVPDGMTVDTEDHLWSAIWGGAQIRRYAPDGTLSRAIDLPARQPSSCAFGGPELDRLYVTSAATGLDPAGPADGTLMVVDQLGVRGRPATPARLMPDVSA